VILFFALLQHICDLLLGSRLQVGSRIIAAVPALAIILAVINLAARGNEVAKLASARWKMALDVTMPSNLQEDATFIDRHAAAGPIGLLANNQASLLAESGRFCAVPGPGIAEILLTADAEHMISYLLRLGPRDLFVGSNLLLENSEAIGFKTWVKFNFERLLTVYAIAERGPQERIIHLTRKP
jgi:hypothetical protein